MKNKQNIILFAASVAIVIYFISTKSPEGTNPTNKQTPEVMATPTPTLTMKEQHMQMYGDGKTIMMMGGDFSPKTIYATPGAMVKFLNHESDSYAFMADDHKSFMTTFVEPGGEATLKMPMAPGSYPFHIHEKDSDKMHKGGTVIVEAEKEATQ